MTVGRIKIAGSRPDGGPLRGQDVRILLVDPASGVETLIPALELTLRVSGRNEQAVAIIAVPAAIVDVHGIKLETQFDIAPGGPESQWEEALGKQPGEAVADVEQYAEQPHVAAFEPAKSVLDTQQAGARSPLQDWDPGWEERFSAAVRRVDHLEARVEKHEADLDWKTLNDQVKNLRAEGIASALAPLDPMKELDDYIGGKTDAE